MCTYSCVQHIVVYCTAARPGQAVSSETGPGILTSSPCQVAVIPTASSASSNWSYDMISTESRCIRSLERRPALCLLVSFEKSDTTPSDCWRDTSFVPYRTHRISTHHTAWRLRSGRDAGQREMEREKVKSNRQLWCTLKMWNLWTANTGCLSVYNIMHACTITKHNKITLRGRISKHNKKILFF